jgi:signal peptidase II
MDAAPLPPPSPLGAVGGAAGGGTGPAARHSKAAWITLAVVTVVALATDLASKHWAFANIGPAPVIVNREEVLAIARVDPGQISRVIPRHDPMTVIPHVLELTLVLNSGAVFGMGQGQRWAFMVFTTLAIAAAVGVFAYWTRAKDRWAHAAIGLLIAGGIGNFYDRLVYGCVRDFIHPLPGVPWPFGLKLMGRVEIWPYVSNVADAFLLVGIAILAFFLWRHDPKHRGRGMAGTRGAGLPGAAPQASS